MKKRVIAVLIVTATVLAVAGLAWQRYWYYLPGLRGDLQDPVGRNRPVAWQSGPAMAEVPPGQRKPNIIVILADDLGYNDLTFNGGGVAAGAVPTPNIDSIARDGITMANGYAGNATCAPSRAAILTGRNATRFGFEFTPTPVAFSRLIHKMSADRPPSLYHAELEASTPPMPAMAVPTHEVMLGEILQKQGYHTLFLGKWHLGETPEAQPQRRGFDETLGFLQGAALFLPRDSADTVNSYQDFDPIDKFLWANLRFAVQRNGGPRFAPSAYLTDYLADEASKAIVANRNRPFFMYLAFNAVHTPLQALKADYDALPNIPDHRLRVYAAMVRGLDRGVGKVLDTLKANGLEDNTLVVFTSDNGGAHYIGLPDINRPYRGWKATFFEGGVHVPYFVKWPAVLPRGRRFDPPVAHIDIAPTVAAAAGAAMPADRVVDGTNLLPFVTGATPGRPHQTLFFRDGHYEMAIAGDWKLQVSTTQDKVWLFDLGADPTEHVDLAASRPEVVAEIRAALARHDAEQVKPIWPSLLEHPIPIDHPGGMPIGPQDEYIYWSN
jgi:arylsulfatase A-like enzyme